MLKAERPSSSTEFEAAEGIELVGVGPYAKPCVGIELESSVSPVFLNGRGVSRVAGADALDTRTE